MNAIMEPVADMPAGVGIADGPEHLSVLKEPGCAAALWPRQMPSDVAYWLANLDPETLPSGRVILQPKVVPGAVRQLCDIANTPRCAARDWLEADIAHMAETFAALMSANFLRLRLDVVTNNACRKFHIDAVTARLVCTYRGQGTQYGISQNGQDPTEVFQAATGAPILLRGTLWPETPSSGLRHRSPPIEGTGESRLLLVLDPISNPEDEG